MVFKLLYISFLKMGGFFLGGGGLHFVDFVVCTYPSNHVSYIWYNYVKEKRGGLKDGLLSNK